MTITPVRIDRARLEQRPVSSWRCSCGQRVQRFRDQQTVRCPRCAQAFDMNGRRQRFSLTPSSPRSIDA